MTTIPGTDLTTEAARNIAARGSTHWQAANALRALADAYENAVQTVLNTEAMTARSAIEVAKSIADRDKYSTQEAAAAWDVVDALQTLRTTGEHVTPDPTQDDRDGKAYARAAEYVTEGLDDCD